MTISGTKKINKGGSFIQMAGAEDIVFEISGNAHMDCYHDLQFAVEIAYANLPTQLRMKDLTAAIVPKLKTKKEASSVARALARAAEDAWDHDGREVLQKKYGFRHKPTPKELVFTLARSMKKPVEYQLWKEESSGKYGILSRSPRENRWMAVAPFLKDENKAAAVVHFLNQTQMPWEHVQEFFFNDAFLNLIEGDADP